MAIIRWTKEQTIVALNLYCKIPFNRVTSTHPEIIRVAKIIGRSTNSLKMKIGNFGSFDPELKRRGIVGLANTSKLDELVWLEFNDHWENLAFESEKLMAHFAHKTLEESLMLDVAEFPQGREREAIIKARINQSFFRSTILSSYNSTCCITGLAIPDFLVASHIVPWAINEKVRLNPHNGLCLNSIHDRAFDRGFITITADYKIKISKCLLDLSHDTAVHDFFIKHDNLPIRLPDKFLPDQAFLAFHAENIFRQ
ncbi:MAG: HNH endonuclease [Gallionella sp.]